MEYNEEESQENRKTGGFLQVDANALAQESVLPSAQWAGGLKAGGEDHDDGDGEVIATDQDVMTVLNLLNQRHLHISEQQRHQLNDAKEQTGDTIFSNWTTEHNYSDDEEERVKDFDENHRLEKLWSERHPLSNWILAISFHVIVIVNFLYCMWESFGIIIEDAKFDFLYLEDVYQCLTVVPSEDSLSHFVSILHATTCVAVLHAKTLQTANLCWAFLIGTTLHSCFKVYEVLFHERFTLDELVHESSYGKMVQLVVVLVVQLIAVLIILQRYYDLTATFHKRSHKFVTQTYEGRQLNDRIIYRNVSSFVQRKYVLRSCHAFQIYNTVKKIQVFRKRLRKGEKINEDSMNKDVAAAVMALKEVEGYKGMEMMRELKRRNYERLKDDYEIDDVDDNDNDDFDENREPSSENVAAKEYEDEEMDPH